MQIEEKQIPHKFRNKHLKNVGAYVSGGGSQTSTITNTVSIYDGLDSANTDVALSANMGKVLQDTKIDETQLDDKLDTLKDVYLSKTDDDQAAGLITFNKGIVAKTRQSSDELLSTASTGIIEYGAVEEGFVATGIIEISEAVGGATTLGGLNNVDDSFDTLADGTFAFEMKDGVLHPISVSNIGGGGVVKLVYVSDGITTVSYGNDTFIKFNFTSTINGESTGSALATYTVNNKVIKATTIQQGETSFNVGQYLALGNNSVKVDVTDSYGTIRSITYTIEAVSISVSSTFDYSNPFSDAITYKFTPIGAIEKTVHFLVDGVEVGTMTTSYTNRQLTYSINKQTHGSHTLEVYMTADVENAKIESNHLYYELMCIDTSNSNPVIASSYRGMEAEQYSTIQIPYVVYTPEKLNSSITLSVNGQILSTLTVSRTEQVWSYRVNTIGDLILAITCGETTKTFHLSVTKSAIEVDAETVDLELYLSSMGRSNSEDTKSVWSYGDIAATLTDFNYSTNGWVTDDNGNVVLRVSGDARVDIPLKVFEKDLRVNGKTIEFEFSTRNVVDYDAVIISCWDNGKGIQITAQKALFVSTQTAVTVQFKEEERVRISFVIEETAENRLIYTYINGIQSGVVQYPTNDSFAQVKPSNILIGNNEATVDLYNIRSYSNNLNQFQVLDNYIADMDDVDLKIDLYNRNQIYDAYGAIQYGKLLEKIPCMTIIGDLPNYKGDKRTVSIVYEDAKEPANSFTSENVQIDVQGTSSQYYPRKNYKMKHKSGFYMTASGEVTKDYKLRPDSIGVNTFCEKADFAESSGTHNTGMAKIVDKTLKALGFLAPPQQANSQIRTTVDGFPIIIFHKANAEGDATFLGKYNFNNDKSTQNTFGFSGDNECWEFKNNTSDRVLFLGSDFAAVDTNGTPDWLNDFEARYPDDDDLNAQYEAGKIPENLKRVCDWIVSTKDDPVKFKTECGDYFNVDFLLSYCIITELFAMVDQRAKNIFLATWDGLHWYPIFYDNDTCCGINNEGDIAFGYNVEYGDAIGTQNVWNATNSVLWKNVESAYASELSALYKRIRTEDILSYEDVIEVMNTEQSDHWCESVYNADGQYKYIAPLIDGYYDYGSNSFVKTGAYLYALQGSRAEHRKWWLYNRFRYLDSKYDTGNYVSDFVTMRLYTPENWQGVTPDPAFLLTPYSDQYLKVKFGSYGTKSVRAGRNLVTLMEPPTSQTLNDTETIIYGASRLKSIGNLSGKYASTIDVSKAVKLEELIIGSEVQGYKNTNLKTLSVGNNEMLRRINVANCSSLTQSLDISGCDNIEEIYAQGSSITGVALPSGGSLKILHLPDTIKSLTISNQPKLSEDGFQIEGVSLLTTLVLENTNIDTFALLTKCFSESIFALERVRLIDVVGSTDSTSLLAELVGMGGVDENGNDISEAIVTGICNVEIVYRDDYDVIVNTFKELSIDYKYMCVKIKDPVLKKFLVARFDVNVNGEVDESEAKVQKTFDYFARGNTAIVSLEGIEEMNLMPAIDSDYDGYYSGQFQKCTSLKTACFPKVNTKVFASMFNGCTSLEDVRFHNGIVSIKEGAFLGCASLKKIVFPPLLNYIGGNAFQGTAFDSIVIPDSVITLSSRAFAYCENLAYAIVGDGCTSIGDNAFGYCPKMKYAVIGSGVISFGMTLFRENALMEYIIIKAPVPPSCGYAPLEPAKMMVYVPDESLDLYKTASYFSGIKSRIFPLSQAPTI